MIPESDIDWWAENGTTRVSGGDPPGKPTLVPSTEYYPRERGYFYLAAMWTFNIVVLSA